MFERNYRKVAQSVWRDSALSILILMGIWWLYGEVLTERFFDDHLSFFHMLSSKGEALTYVGILFAVQIPIFILLLERMRDSGYVRRHVLPSIIQFREILISYIVLSLLLLVSSRNSYFYLPVLLLTGLSVYTVYEAIRVMFEQRKLKKREDKYVSKLVKRVYSESLRGRIIINDFFKDLKELKYVSHSLLEFGDDFKGAKKYEIKAPRDGQVESIDTKKLHELITKEYYSDIQKTLTTTGQARRNTGRETDYNSKVIILVRPKSVIKKYDPILTIRVAKDAKAPTKSLISGMRNCVDIVYSHPDAADQKLDDLIKDFRQQIRSSINEDSLVSLDDSLGFYTQLTSGLSILGETEDDSGYTLMEARNEFRQFYRDSVSEKLEPIADILTDEFIYAVRFNKRDTIKQLISYIYRDILDVTHDFNMLTVARSDQALIAVMNRIIYADKTEIKDDEYRNEVYKSLAFRLKEHTGLLLYYRRQGDIDEAYTPKQLEEWLVARLQDARGFLLATYKRSSQEMFSDSLRVFEEFESNYGLYEEDMEDLILKARCNLFVAAAYMHDRKDESDIQKQCRVKVDAMLSKLGSIQLTKILMECIDKGLADKWRVDTYDLIADGEVYSIPDFSMKLKSLWTSYMLSQTTIPQDVDLFRSKQLSKTQAFSDGMTKTEDAYLVKHLNSLKGEDKSSALKELVLKFINERKQWEKDTLVNRPLSQKKINEFKADVIKAYNEDSFAIKLYKNVKKLDFTNKAVRGFNSFGWNQVKEKESFIEDWHVGYYMRGEDYGTEIANAQNEYIANELLSKVQKTRDIEHFLSILSAPSNDRWVVFNVGTASWYIREEFNKFIRGSDYHSILFKRVKQVMPALFMYSNSLPKGLYAVKVADLGRFSIKGTTKNPILISIDAYSHNAQLLKSMLNKPPKWLSDRGNKREQEEFLKISLRMLINQPFKLERSKGGKSYYLPLDDKV